MGDCFFTADGPADAEGRQAFGAHEPCVGPWSEDAMHGGPPSALLVRACERAAGVTAGSGFTGDGAAPVPTGDGPGLVALRASVDFFGPVPFAPVEVAARVVRPGRRITRAEASHLARPFRGPWVLLDAATRYTAAGSALATSTIRDASGVVGAGAQTLVVLPRDRQ